MSQPGNGPFYLTDEYAKDVSRMTGLPWHYARVESRGPQVPYLPIADAWQGFGISMILAAGHAFLAAPSEHAGVA